MSLLVSLLINWFTVKVSNRIIIYTDFISHYLMCARGAHLVSSDQVLADYSNVKLLFTHNYHCSKEFKLFLQSLDDKIGLKNYQSLALARPLDTDKFNDISDQQYKDYFSEENTNKILQFYKTDTSIFKCLFKMDL